MSAQNAIQLATAIQSKVGSSLISSQNLLPRAESAGVMTQAGASSLGVFLLRDLYDMQQRTYECVEKVAHILQSQLDLAEDRERRERDQLAEELKEKNKLSGSVVPTAGAGAGNETINNNLDEIEDAINKGTFTDLLGDGLTAALLAPQALRNMGSLIGKRLLKGTIFATIAGFIADPIINYVNTEFDLELDEDAKKEIKLSMIGAAAGFGLAGIPGAIIGATIPMVAKVAQYIGGSLNADEVKDSDFAMAGIGTAAAGMFTASKLGGVFLGSKIPAVATFGAALGSLPVLIGIGAAVAVGAGAMFIAKKVDEYQEMALKKLGETTAKLDREMGEWAAREEEGLFERFGINLGQLSALGEAQVAAAEANEQAGQDINKFTADTTTGTKLKALVDTMANYSDEALKTILLDKTKAENYFSTVESLKAVAAKGGFGKDSGAIFKTLAMMSDRVQNYATKLVGEGVTGGLVEAAAENSAGRIRGQIQGGDQLENLPELLKEKELLLKQQEIKMAELEEAKQKLADLKAQGIEPTFFGENEAEKTADLIKKLEDDLDRDNRNNVFTVGAKLNQIERKINRFGTTNGLLYNFDQLREIMSDEQLADLIQKSVNQQGATFLQQQNAANNRDEGKVNVVSQGNNSGNQQNNYASQNNYVRKMTESGDVYFAKEGFNYGL